MFNDVHFIPVEAVIGPVTLKLVGVIDNLLVPPTLKITKSPP